MHFQFQFRGMKNSKLQLVEYFSEYVFNSNGMIPVKVMPPVMIITQASVLFPMSAFYINWARPINGPTNRERQLTKALRLAKM